MRIGLRHFSSDSIEWFKEAATDPEQTRYGLALGLCEKDNWRNARGELCLASARKRLPTIAQAVGVKLPAPASLPKGMVFGGKAPPFGEGYPDKYVVCSLESLGGVSLEPVKGAEKKLWREMMQTHHPEGWSRTPGKQISYWITTENHGRVGGIGFCAASWHQGARDKWIGWSARARVENLGLVINNHRFLLLPGVRVKNLASHVLSLAISQVRVEWKDIHGTEPVAAYTYISSDHEGSSYKAAGWEMCEEKTSGRPASGGIVESKTVWMKPILRGWKKVLCEEPRHVIGQTPEPYYTEEADWADVEYGRSSHSDGRVRERIIYMGRRWADNPGEPLPVVFPGEAEQRGMYRLLSNKRVTMEHILEPHTEATVSRCRMERVVLAVQDTTTVNYSGHEKTEGLVSIGGKGKGLFVHVGLAITEGRRPLGVYDLNATVRAVGKGKKKNKKQESKRWVEGLFKARELKEACEGTRVVTVCDREGDMWELLREGVEGGDGLLVRSKKGHKRRVVVGEETENLWKHIQSRPVLAKREIEVKACGGKRKRESRSVMLEIRAARVKLVAPLGEGASVEPLDMLAVSAFEPDPPSDKERLHWVLLTTEGEETAEDAVRAIKWYEARWSIEEYFKALKTGTGIKKRRFDCADDLRKCLGFDVVTAYRVFDLERMAREKPDTPAREVAGEEEIDAMYGLLEYEGIIKKRPDEAPDIRTYVVDLARYAGFRPSKRQPLPGTKKLWQAVVKFKMAYAGFRAARQIQTRGP